MKNFLTRSRILALITLVGTPITVKAEFALDTIKPYDLYLWTGPYERGTWQLGGYFDGCFKIRGSTVHHQKVNVLHIWQCAQDALAMVRGFNPDSRPGQLAARLHSASDDGTRGHLIPSACFEMNEGAIGLRYWINHGVSFGVHLPLFHMKLSNIAWHDLTKEVTVGDRLTKELLTNNIAKTVYQLDPGLDISSPWDRRGIGDLSLIARWQQDFAQHKRILTNVQLSVYSGVTLPTGKKIDEDKLFSIPFGNDGSTAIPFGGELQVQWLNHWIGGIELNFEQIFSHTRCRRIKTDQNQTDLLLLAKTNASIDWGFYQRHRLSLGGYHLVRGFSFDLGYQYTHQDDSSLNLCTNKYLECNANSATSLQQWALHQIMVHASYDFGYDATQESKIVPSIGFFYHHTFKGQRAILVDKAGVSISAIF